jgi:hypothetical protein
MIPLNGSDDNTPETASEEAAEPQWLQLSATICPDPEFPLDPSVFQDAFEEFIDAAFGENAMFSNIYLLPASEDQEESAEGE